MEPNRKKRGRPRSVDTPFAIKRATRAQRKVDKQAAYLLLENCTPTDKQRCSCGCFTGYTPEIIWFHRLYMAKRGKGEIREWIDQRTILDKDKVATLPGNNFADVRLYTFSMEKPDILQQGYQRIIESGNNNMILPAPSSSMSHRVCSKFFFYMSTKSRNFFYKPYQRAKGQPKVASDRTFTLVEPSRRPSYTPREHKAMSLCQEWLKEERGRHLIDPGGGEGHLDQRTILPYKDLLEAHAYFVIEAEGMLMSPELAATAREFYYQSDSALCSYGDDSNDGSVQEVVHVANCAGGQAGCSCHSGENQAVNAKGARYGNRLLGMVGSLPVQADIPVYSYFTKLWREPAFDDVVLRKWMPFAACDVCVEHNDMRTRAMTDAERKIMTARYAKHLEFVRRERDTYYKNASMAMRNPKLYLSLIIDGADTSKYHLPHTARRSHLSDACKKVNIHLMGAISHGRDTFFWTSPPHLAQGNNVTIQAIHYILLHTKREEGSLPKYLYLQLDNTSKQCKGRGLLAYLSLLKLFGVFERIFVNFLPVGHTHEDVDQLFSRIAVYLRRNNALCLSQLHAGLKRAVLKYGKRPIVGHWNGVMNISAYLKKYESSASWTQDISLYYTFRIVRGVTGDSKGKVIVQARTYASSSEDAKDDCWRGFTPDTLCVYPFKDVDMATHLPNLHRDVTQQASTFLQGVPQHVKDAMKDGNMSYRSVCSRQADSINHFMACSKLFREPDKAEMRKLLAELPEVGKQFTWDPAIIKYIYGEQPLLLGVASPEMEGSDNIFQHSRGLVFNRVEGDDSVPSENGEDDAGDFGAAHGGQNVVGFSKLEIGAYYLVRSSVVTEFCIYRVKKIRLKDEGNPESKHIGAWAQQWNCGTADCGNEDDDVDFVVHPWYPNALHKWNGKTYNTSRFAMIDIEEFYDKVEMTKDVSPKVRKMLRDNELHINGAIGVMKCITVATQKKAMYLRDRLAHEAAGHI